MSNFKPEMLSVQFIKPVSVTQPIIPRRLTLTHSDATGQLFLTVGPDYAWHNLTPIRDEVLGEWKQSKFHYVFCIYVHIDEGQFDQLVAAKRNEIFRRELSLALAAIKYGDRLFFKTHPYLLQSPIFVHFASSYPQFAGQQYWGTFEHIDTPM